MSAFASGWSVLKGYEYHTRRYHGMLSPQRQEENQRILDFKNALFPKIHGQRTIRVPYSRVGSDVGDDAYPLVPGHTNLNAPFIRDLTDDAAVGGEMGEFEVDFLGISPKEDRALIEDEMEFYGGAPIGHYTVSSRAIPDYPPNTPSYTTREENTGGPNMVEDAKRMVLFALERQFPGFIERIARGEIDVDDYMKYFRVID